MKKEGSLTPPRLFSLLRIFLLVFSLSPSSYLSIPPKTRASKLASLESFGKGNSSSKKMSSEESLKSLSLDYLNLLINGQAFSDVAFSVDGHLIHAHRYVLFAAASSSTASAAALTPHRGSTYSTPTATPATTPFYWSPTAGPINFSEKARAMRDRREGWRINFLTFLW